ncbi:MAG: DNA polymerase III subunit delta [Parcubacteria group bacterium Gr01-1014_70]|nr:MAG: DNA polymerase III subunit delta [Parcubacteria group bacterium Gr01-1014_70]
MIYLFYGEDTYRSHKKVRDITDRFYMVAGGRESAVHVMLPECSRQEVEQILTTGSLFYKKRLVVLEEPSGAATDVMAYIEERLPLLAKSDDIFLIWDTRIFVAAAALAAKVQEFKCLTTQDTARFLDEEAKSRGIALSPAARRRILAQFTGDSWRIIQELEKSALMKEETGEGTYTAEHGSSEIDRMVYALVDAYGLAQRPKALQLYTTLLGAGIEPEKIFWRLLSHVRTVVSVNSLLRSGVAAGDIPRVANMHPFVAKKAVGVAARVPEQDLMRRHTSLVLLDFETKQGRGDMTLGLEWILLSL